jgi:small-conductance mechanosensitive channel
MPFDSLTDDPVILRFIAVGIAVSGVTLAALVYFILGLIIRRLARGISHAIAPQILRAMRNPAAFMLGVFGVFVGLLSLPEGDIIDLRDNVRATWAFTAIVVIARALTNVIAVVINWYVRTIAPRTSSQFDDQMLPLIRRFLVIAVWGIALVMVLDVLGFSISPILGGLGITGIAVALALQPTLSNFFAGTYVLSDGAITVGDYIELNSGPAGYVIEVGWRSTKIRTWLNNLVIIPNSVMADTIITNYSRPSLTMNLLVTSGVSYSSDLQKVEEVSLEVANQIIQEMPQASKVVDAYFGYEKFGDSNIEFWIYLQAKDRFGSFVVTNELIKRLHARFTAEGIEINYPVRKIVYEGARPPSGLPVTDTL